MNICILNIHAFMDQRRRRTDKRSWDLTLNYLICVRLGMVIRSNYNSSEKFNINFILFFFALYFSSKHEILTHNFIIVHEDMKIAKKSTKSEIKN